MKLIEYPMPISFWEILAEIRKKMVWYLDRDLYWNIWSNVELQTKKPVQNIEFFLIALIGEK